jgi:hypothetical protein
MPDVYTHIGDAAPAILSGLMTALELRAADPQQRALGTTWTPVQRHFGHILSMIRGWCGVSPG